jgi:hypothetical protein
MIRQSAAVIRTEGIRRRRRRPEIVTVTTAGHVECGGQMKQVPSKFYSHSCL